MVRLLLEPAGRTQYGRTVIMLALAVCRLLVDETVQYVLMSHACSSYAIYVSWLLEIDHLHAPAPPFACMHIRNTNNKMELQPAAWGRRCVRVLHVINLTISSYLHLLTLISPCRNVKLVLHVL